MIKLSDEQGRVLKDLLRAIGKDEELSAQIEMNLHVNSNELDQICDSLNTQLKSNQNEKPLNYGV